MARIRTIKPEFFMSEDMGALTVNSRLLYIALWCHADRGGKLKYQRTALMCQCMPFEMDKFDECMAELEAKGHLHSYEVDGRKYLFLPTFLHHQRPHGTEKESEIPNPDGYLTVNSPLDDGEYPAGKGKGKGTEKGKGDISAEPPSDSAPVIALPLNDRSEFDICTEQIAEWAELYPAVDVLQELRNMRGWCVANPTKRKTRRGILRFVTSWLARTQDRGGTKSGSNGVLPRNDAELESWATQHGYRKPRPGESYPQYRTALLEMHQRQQ